MRSRLLALALMLAAALVPLAPAGARPASTTCRPWHVRTLVNGQGWLESVAFDGRGGMLLSALTQGRILRLGRHGRLSVERSGLHAPGGEVVRGRFLYFTTGDTVPPANDGTIDRLDLRTGRLTVWARGLSMPNGLAFLPNGDAVVSRDLETFVSPTDITRVSARTRRAHVNWARVPDSNGLVVDPSGRWLYSDRTFSSRGTLVRIQIAHPGTVQVIGHLGVGSGPDDMSLGPHGVLLVAGYIGGAVYRFDPARRRACTLARGLTAPTAVVPAGAGWPSADLFVTSAAGMVYELTPPAG